MSEPNKFRITYCPRAGGWVVTVELVAPLAPGKKPSLVLSSLHDSLEAAERFGDWWCDGHLDHDFDTKRKLNIVPSQRDWSHYRPVTR
jgi:hypothetical protein